MKKRENKKKEGKKGKILVLTLAFAFALILTSGLASACHCGDGAVNQPTEECDDGNIVNNDGCSGVCKIEHCGDGILQTNEECDDGNLVNGDGCSSECDIEEECNIELVKLKDKTNVKPGDIVTFTLKYKNIGNGVCTGTGVKIQDTLNENLNYMGSFTENILNDIDGEGLDPGWYELLGYDALTNTLTWNAHAVSPNEEGTITYGVEVSESEECGDFEIPNYFRAWSNQEGWKNSNTVNLLVDNDCPSCGDGNLDAGEECDDGNLVNGDGCSATCEEECLPCCGDGVLDIGEECDDGNLNNLDSCRNNCKFPYCGDGILDAGEECDDHNNVNGDRCSAECQTEFPPCEYNISVRYSYGNSFGTGIAINNSEDYNWVSETPAHLNQGIHKIRYYVDNHEAEDNNASITVKLDNVVLISYYQNIDASHYKTLSLDTSNLECGSLHNISVEVQSESNGICTNDNTSDNYAKRAIYIDCEEEHYCGDGSLDAGEECDLGGENGEMCTPAYGGICNYCSSKCEEIVLTDGYCGDGILQSQYEECDDGNLEEGDGCSANCDEEEQEFCIENISIRKSYSNSFGTGIALGFENGTWISEIPANLEKGNYKVRYYIDNNIANTTNNAHLLVKLDSNILFNYSYIISKYHSKTFNLDTNNLQCDVLYTISVEVDSQHNIFCTPDDISDNSAERNFYVRCEEVHYCGDGNLDAGEECDDGNTEDGDGCSANCDEEQEPPRCGDGIVNQANETCDDGNLVNNDGCSNTCKIEYCGDGVKQTGEECDLGILNGNVCTPLYGSSCSYCSSLCNNITLTDGYCGDGIKQGSELCDDRNTNNLDTCRNNCKFPYCGDGIKDKNEYCDDGNSVNGDGCSKTCRFECPNGICTPNITIETFIPRLWLCDSRLVYDDATRPGRISFDGQPLVERLNNYAFEGEQIKWKVLVMDKNGVDKIKDVYVTVDGNIEANCKRITGNQMDETCNARILEENVQWNSKLMSYYECTFTVETSDSMYGQSEIAVEAEDLDGEIGNIDETESWFLNPFVSLGVDGGVVFNYLRPGTTEYSDPVIISNNADSGSGVLLDVFVSGTNFYDSSSSGAKCPTTNQLSLKKFSYYASSGGYTTLQDSEIGRTCDDEGYCSINYGIGFNNPYVFYNKNEIIQAQKIGSYYAANLLAPGADMSLIFRIDVPEPCNGNFDSGHIYFWGEAV